MRRNGCGKWPDPKKGLKGTWKAPTNTIKRSGRPVLSLPKLKTNKNTLTLAGFSSGAFKTAYIFNQWASKL